MSPAYICLLPAEFLESVDRVDDEDLEELIELEEVFPGSQMVGCAIAATNIADEIAASDDVIINSDKLCFPDISSLFYLAQRQTAAKPFGAGPRVRKAARSFGDHVVVPPEAGSPRM